MGVMRLIKQHFLGLRDANGYLRGLWQNGNSAIKNGEWCRPAAWS
jgi:hypothetical protein